MNRRPVPHPVPGVRNEPTIHSGEAASESVIGTTEGQARSVISICSFDGRNRKSLIEQRNTRNRLRT